MLELDCPENFFRHFCYRAKVGENLWWDLCHRYQQDGKVLLRLELRLKQNDCILDRDIWIARFEGELEVSRIKKVAGREYFHWERDIENTVRGRSLSGTMIE